MVAKECTTPSREEMRRIVVDFADVIVVSGGNSLFAMLRWQSIGLDLLIKEAAMKGAVLCGGSAGCGCWFDTVSCIAFDILCEMQAFCFRARYMFRLHDTSCS